MAEIRSILLCSDQRDCAAVRKAIRTGGPHAELGRFPGSVATIATRSAAAAAQVGRVVGEERAVSTVTLVIRDAEAMPLSRISHAVAGGDSWFCDLHGARLPLRQLSESATAWAFAAACTLLSPDSVLGFAGGPDDDGLLELALTETDARARELRSLRRRHFPNHVQAARDAARVLAAEASLTVSQSLLLERVAVEAAVRRGVEPVLSARALVACRTKSDRNREMRLLVERLERDDREAL